MSRPFKSGVDYFPLDVNLDEKFELVESEHGIVGFGVLIKLYQKIYANNYWVTCNKRTILVFSNRINVDINKVTAIINSCVEWEIFDKKMFDEYEILTSKGIQKRFFEITKRRQDIEVIKEYTLVSIPETDNITVITVGSNLKNVNSSTQRKGKERKKKEFTYTDAFEKWWESYPKRGGRRVGKKIAYTQFNKIDKSEWILLKSATDNYKKECGEFPKDAERFLKNDFWKDYIGTAEKDKAKDDGRAKAEEEYRRTQEYINS